MTSLQTRQELPSPAWPEPPVEQERTLSTYAGFIVTYRALLIVALVAGLVGGVLVHLSKPVRYTSTAHMVIVATTVGADDETTVDVSIDSALQLLRSDQVIGQVARDIDYPGGAVALNEDVTTRPITNSRIVRLSVAARDPQTALQATLAITDRFFEVRRQGLEAAAASRAEAVDAELGVVEDELSQRYRLVPEAELMSGEESVEDQIQSDTTGIARLVTRRAQLSGEKASLAMAESNPGYLSRPPTEALQGNRSGLAITVTSVLTLTFVAAVGLAALHGRQPPRDLRGQHRQPLLARKPT